MSGKEELQEHLNAITNEVDRVVVEGSRAHKLAAKVAEAVEEGVKEAADDTPSSSLPDVDVTKLNNAQLVQYLAVKEYEKQMARYERMKSKIDMTNAPKDHKFWNTQPVVPLSQEVLEGNGPIDDTVTVDKVKQEPYNMPTGFTWCSLDVTNPAEVLELYNLLNENYVEDDDCMFRFDYSIGFLQWALTQPGYLKDWHVGVRNAKTGVLMGCITAVPVEVRVYDRVVHMAEINFLCVHKKLRTKRLAPVLIKEITRRVNLTDRWQAVYTAGVVLPKPVGRCRYYHRSLNPKKLIEVRFSSLPAKTTLANHIKTLKLPAKPIYSFRSMTEADVPGVHELLNNYLQSKAKLAQVFSLEDIAHNLLPRKEVVNTFVLETDGKITDMCSFYYLPSTVIGNPLHNKLNAVYSYYNVATTMSFEDLMKDLLIFARNDGADVFNALDVMDNGSSFTQLQFGAGDGFLQYYVYNWKCPQMTASEVGLVLL